MAETRTDAEASKTTAAAYVAALTTAAEGTGEVAELAAGILANKEYLTKKSVWIFGGDGWAYDIGYGGLDHVLASGKDVNVFVFDTEVYSNTGGQASKASNLGQVAQFAAAGKDVKKKSLAEIAMTYGYVCVAQVAMGANLNQTIKAITEAEAYPGPSLIIGYSPCEMHSIKGGMTNCQTEMKKAVDCGYWNLLRFNPEGAPGKKLVIDSKDPAEGEYQNFLMNEARYSRLTREFPERAEELFAENEQAAMARWSHLQAQGLAAYAADRCPWPAVAERSARAATQRNAPAFPGRNREPPGSPFFGCHRVCDSKSVDCGISETARSRLRHFCDSKSWIFSRCSSLDLERFSLWRSVGQLNPRFLHEIDGYERLGSADSKLASRHFRKTPGR